MNRPNCRRVLERSGNPESFRGTPPLRMGFRLLTPYRMRKRRRRCALPAQSKKDNGRFMVPMHAKNRKEALHEPERSVSTLQGIRGAR
jgi:hypothetical protein